ncbi:MAG TPA: holo-ACP synthase [Desulfobacterales bacterium]|nr:holo-ACP synthase [Desulfobacterales bacterium]
MIYGIGVDLVDISRMERVLKRWGDRFVDRVFTPVEKKTSYKRVRPYPAFALRFAAKEAFSKALGLGMRGGVKWKEIEVYNDSRGKPGIRTSGTTLSICKERGIDEIHLSLSDEGQNAIAMVVLEKGHEIGKRF